MGLFISVILPIIMVFAVGFILQKFREVDVRSVSTLSLYILSPALVFVGLYDAEFDDSYIVIFVFMFVLLYVMVGLNKILAKIFKWETKTESAAILATGFMNSGNYGLPVVLFSLGEQAIPYAIFIMVVQSLQNNFFGIYYASRNTSGVKTALLNVMKMPTTYAAFLAIGFQLLDVSIPNEMYSTLSMVGDAAIPVMMLILGLQLGSMTKIKLNWEVIISSVVLKMAIAPIVAILFVWMFDVDPLIGYILIIIAGMPTAATTTMYAIEFDTEPDLVSSITFISTVISVVSLSVLLNVVL